MAVYPVGVQPRRPIQLQVRPDRAVRRPIDDLICLYDVRPRPVLAGDQHEHLPHEYAILGKHRHLIRIIRHHLDCNVLAMHILVQEEHSLRELPENARKKQQGEQECQDHFIYYNLSL